MSCWNRASAAPWPSPATCGTPAGKAILGSADLAERWGWVTRTLPEAGLDAFVDATVARLASFDRQAPATAKAMVGRATLPPDADLIAAYGDFTDVLEAMKSSRSWLPGAASLWLPLLVLVCGTLPGTG